MAAKVESYRLRPAARADLSDIWDRTTERWSMAQAERYTANLRATLDLLVQQPEMARERRELRPPVRVHPSGSHLILYRIEGNYLDVLRFRHHNEDWQNNIEGWHKD